jgi:tetratricopeptide (TPR) repeat protein
MTTFQIIMLVATAFFAFKVYEHVQGMQAATASGDEPSEAPEASGPDTQKLIGEADDAYEAGDTGRAGQLLAEANLLAPGTPEILNKLAFILSKEGKHEEAVTYYEESLSVDPSDDLAHNALASLYRTMGRYDRARRHYEEALAIDPAYEVTYFNYANLLVDMEETEEAKAMYRKALEIKPDFMQAKFELEKLS